MPHEYSSRRAGRLVAAMSDAEPVKCPRCSETMKKMQACHLVCPNCGAHLDCSDKGSFW